MANIKDIAKLAGVSVATVSKVLNGQPGISSDTAEFVRETARKLNYTPNLFARNLKRGNSRAIGIITEDITVFNTASIVDGIGASCEDHGYRYFLENLRINQRGIDPIIDHDKYNEILSDSFDFMASVQADGVIYLSCHGHSILNIVPPEGMRLVCAYCSTNDPTIPSVLYDDKKAAYCVTRMLIDEGHTKIGTITGPSSSTHAANRLFGYQEALFESSLPYNPARTITGDWSRDSGYDAGKRLIESGVTAIFAQNDIMALGVIEYCNKKGIEIGRDISLVGFDNREISEVCRPTLTTVALPLTEIGHHSAETLFDLIDGKPVPEDTHTLLECRIIRRDSVGRIND